MIEISHACILTPDGWIEDGSLLIEHGKISEISGEPGIPRRDGVEWRTINAGGKMLLPGFIDLHVHGGGGYDAMMGNVDDLLGMCGFHASRGTTSLLATTLTAPQDEILRALRAVAAAMKLERKADGAHLLGVHLEGPFLNIEKCGAQNPADLHEPDMEEFKEFWSASDGAIKVVTVAPELARAEELIKYAAGHGVTVSLGHTNADYETMASAVEWGATQVTHVFNGMRGFHHREPGAAGAALMLDRLAVEVICDGEHIHPDLIKWIFAVKPAGKVIMITDSMCAAGCPDGDYLLGKLPVVMRKGTVHLKQQGGGIGSLAGSSLTMIDALKKASVFTGLDIADIVPAMTLHPAIQIGVADSKGSIELGKDADVILLDEQFRVCRTYVMGALVYDAEGQ